MLMLADIFDYEWYIYDMKDMTIEWTSLKNIKKMIRNGVEFGNISSDIIKKVSRETSTYRSDNKKYSSYNRGDLAYADFGLIFRSKCWFYEAEKYSLYFKGDLGRILVSGKYYEFGISSDIGFINGNMVSMSPVDDIMYCGYSKIIGMVMLICRSGYMEFSSLGAFYAWKSLISRGNTRFICNGIDCTRKEFKRKCLLDV